MPQGGHTCGKVHVYFSRVSEIVFFSSKKFFFLFIILFIVLLICLFFLFLNLFLFILVMKGVGNKGKAITLKAGAEAEVMKIRVTEVMGMGEDMDTFCPQMNGPHQSHGRQDPLPKDSPITNGKIMRCRGHSTCTNRGKFGSGLPDAAPAFPSAPLTFRRTFQA